MVGPFSWVSHHSTFLVAIVCHVDVRPVRTHMLKKMLKRYHAPKSPPSSNVLAIGEAIGTPPPSPSASEPPALAACSRTFLHVFAAGLLPCFARFLAMAVGRNGAAFCGRRSARGVAKLRAIVVALAIASLSLNCSPFQSHPQPLSPSLSIFTLPISLKLHSVNLHSLCQSSFSFSISLDFSQFHTVYESSRSVDFCPSSHTLHLCQFQSLSISVKFQSRFQSATITIVGSHRGTACPFPSRCPCLVDAHRHDRMHACILTCKRTGRNTHSKYLPKANRCTCGLWDTPSLHRCHPKKRIAPAPIQNHAHHKKTAKRVPASEYADVHMIY